VRPTAGDPIAGLPDEVRGERLVHCRYFRIDRYHIAGPFDSPYPGCLAVWMVLEGTVDLQGDSYRRTFRRGETALVPASCGGLSWRPNGQAGAVTLLGITLPRDGPGSCLGGEP